MAEYINIHHIQDDETLATFYCVMRMPNGRLGLANTKITASYLNNESTDVRAAISELVFRDLQIALKNLSRRD